MRWNTRTCGKRPNRIKRFLYEESLGAALDSEGTQSVSDHIFIGRLMARINNL